MEGKNANQTQPLINEIEDFKMANAIITIETIAEASMKDMVVFWNAHHADKPISKFSDRKTAERRITELLKRLENEAPAQVETDAPVFKPRAEQQELDVSTGDEKPEDEITEEEALEEIRAAAAKRKEEAEKKGAKSGLTIGQAIAKSWEDPSVAAARATRDGVSVTVNGITNQFGSVRKAFAALGLPDSKHIRFRGKLKTSKEMVFEWAGQSYLFKII